MISLKEAQERLIFHESMVLMPYRCPAGYLSIGVGRNLETNPLTSEELKACGDYKNGITKNAALFLLRNDINKCIKQLQENISFWNKLDNERQYALLDMNFNLGINGLLKFKKMIYFMSIKDYKEASKECLNSKYAKDTGKRARRIAKLIETGVFEI